mgnify:CR=1 FL=1
MYEALKEAKKAYLKEEVPIGAVIVKDGKVIARAHNLREKTNNAISHAEILAIEKACKKLNSWRLEDCTIYVTLEPCPMCLGAMMQARIKKVYYGALDKKNGAILSIGNMLDLKTTWNLEHEYIECKESSEILTNFFKELRNSKKINNK